MEEQELISERIKALEASVQFYSNKHKAERELWVVRSFLENLRIPYSDGELTPVNNDPPDVRYKDAEFEIKEILDSGRRRHDEYKKELEKSRYAKSTDEFFKYFKPRNLSISEIFYLCLNEVKELRNKYSPSTRTNTDLLFYVNLRHVMDIVEDPFPNTEGMAKEGWRSVSFFEGAYKLLLIR